MAQWNNNQNQGGNSYGNRPSCSFDVKFRLNDDGSCPQCNTVGEFFTSQAGKPFEKCQNCLKMAGSRRAPGYQPRPANQFFASSLPTPPAHIQPPAPVFGTPQGVIPPQAQQQQTPDNFQLINEIRGLHDAINHLTNSIHLATSQHEQGLAFVAKALDAFTGSPDASKTLEFMKNYKEMV